LGGGGRLVGRKEGNEGADLTSRAVPDAEEGCCDWFLVVPEAAVCGEAAVDVVGGEARVPPVFSAAFYTSGIRQTYPVVTEQNLSTLVVISHKEMGHTCPS
jgi:hypothetical protein